MSSRNVRFGELVESHFRVFLCTLRSREHIHFFKSLFYNLTITHGILQSEPQVKNSTQDFLCHECCLLITLRNQSIPVSRPYRYYLKGAFLQASWRSVIMPSDFLCLWRFRCLRRCRNLPAPCPKNHSSP